MLLWGVRRGVGLAGWSGPAPLESRGCRLQFMQRLARPTPPIWIATLVAYLTKTDGRYTRAAEPATLGLSNI